MKRGDALGALLHRGESVVRVRSEFRFLASSILPFQSFACFCLSSARRSWHLTPSAPRPAQLALVPSLCALSLRTLNEREPSKPRRPLIASPGVVERLGQAAGSAVARCVRPTKSSHSNATTHVSCPFTDCLIYLFRIPSLPTRQTHSPPRACHRNARATYRLHCSLARALSCRRGTCRSASLAARPTRRTLPRGCASVSGRSMAIAFSSRTRMTPMPATIQQSMVVPPMPTALCGTQRQRSASANAAPTISIRAFCARRARSSPIKSAPSKQR